MVAIQPHRVENAGALDGKSRLAPTVEERRGQGQEEEQDGDYEAGSDLKNYQLNERRKLFAVHTAILLSCAQII
jgi:hypothetical protein